MNTQTPFRQQERRQVILRPEQLQVPPDPVIALRPHLGISASGAVELVVTLRIEDLQLNNDVPAPWGRVIVAVTFYLGELRPAIQDHAPVWAALGLRRYQRPVRPNHGKAVTGLGFESAEWLVEVWN